MKSDAFWPIPYALSSSQKYIFFCWHPLDQNRIWPCEPWGSPTSLRQNDCHDTVMKCAWIWDRPWRRITTQVSGNASMVLARIKAYMNLLAKRAIEIGSTLILIEMESVLESSALCALTAGYKKRKGHKGDSAWSVINKNVLQTVGANSLCV